MRLKFGRIKLFYRCRDIGYGVESGWAIGFWTGELDAWNKHAFNLESGGLMYLFPDEVVQQRTYHTR